MFIQKWPWNAFFFGQIVEKIAIILNSKLSEKLINICLGEQSINDLDAQKWRMEIH